MTCRPRLCLGNSFIHFPYFMNKETATQSSLVTEAGTFGAPLPRALFLINVNKEGRVGGSFG